MKFFKCEADQMTFTIVDLPRKNWNVCPPKKWQIALTLTGIVVAAIMWAIL